MLKVYEENKKEEQDVYLKLEQRYDGVTLVGVDKKGNAICQRNVILQIKDGVLKRACNCEVPVIMVDELGQILESL